MSPFGPECLAALASAGNPSYFGAMKNALSVLCLLLLLLSGCSPANEEETGTRLRRLRFVAPASPTSPQQASHLDLEYDASGRVVRIQCHMGDTEQPGDTTMYRIRFTYSGADLLPTNIISSEGQPAFTRTHYLQYDGNGQVAKDSLVMNNGDVTIYSFARSGSIITRTISGNIQTEPAAGARDTLRFENDNLVYFRRSHPQRYIRSELQYDTRYNPIGRLNIAPVFPVLGLESDPTKSFWSVWQYGRNNMTRYQRWTGIYPTPDEEFVRSYSYRSDSFPSSSELRFSSGDLQETLFFVYE